MIAVKEAPPLQGVAWTADKLSAQALTKCLRTVSIVKVRSSIEDAEEALTQATVRALGTIDDSQLSAINADVMAISLHRYWPAREHYTELWDAVRAEVDRRKIGK